MTSLSCLHIPPRRYEFGHSVAKWTVITLRLEMFLFLRLLLSPLHFLALCLTLAASRGHSVKMQVRGKGRARICCLILLIISGLGIWFVPAITSSSQAFLLISQPISTDGLPPHLTVSLSIPHLSFPPRSTALLLISQPPSSSHSLFSHPIAFFLIPQPPSPSYSLPHSTASFLIPQHRSISHSLLPHPRASFLIPQPPSSSHLPRHRLTTSFRTHYGAASWPFPSLSLIA